MTAPLAEMDYSYNGRHGRGLMIADMETVEGRG